MAGNVKGITIEFRGDTTSLDKALRQINSETRDIDKELKQVNRALKFNPGNVELLKQKQTLLNQKLAETNEKAKLLKDTLKKVKSGEIEMTAEDTRELERELIVAESQAKNFKKQIQEIGNANLTALSTKLKEIGGNITAIGNDLTTKVTLPLVAGFTLASGYASDYEENLNKIDVAFGDNSESVKEWANSASEAYGLSKVQATSAVSAFGALGKGIGLSESEAAGMATTLTGLSADLASYFNTSTDESAKALEGIFTGETEALKKYGIVMSETNLKQFAEDQGLVYDEMSQGEKTALRYQYVLEKTKDAQGDYSRTSDGTANSIKTFQATLQDLATTIGTNLLPIITPIIQKVTEWVGKFNELSPQTQKIITIIGLVVAALGPVLVIIGTLISSIGAIVGAIGMITAPMLGIVAIIAAVIAIGVLLYKNWDTIKAKALALWNTLKTTFNGIKTSIINAWNSIKARVISIVQSVVGTVAAKFHSLKTTVSTIWNNIKTAITTPITTAVETVKGAIQKIKDFFAGLKFELPKFKLPHFTVTGKFPYGIGGEGVKPSISVDWYASGGIFDSPHLIGIGERGAEAVVPLDILWKKLDNIADASGGNGAVVVNVYGADNMSVNELAAAVEQRLIQMQKRRSLAWQ